MSTSGASHRLRRIAGAAWAVRWAALVILSPALGLVIVAAIFGLAPAMLRVAIAMSSFGCLLLIPLLRAEYRRLPEQHREQS